MIWWHWVVLGLVLAAIELATPGGFFVIFFAIAALLLGVLELTGLLESDVMQWVLLPVVSLVLLALFRKPLLGLIRHGEPDTVDSLVGEVATAVELIPAGQHGRAEMRGSRWSARNLDQAALIPGQRCRVVAVRGLELDLRSE